LVAAELERRWEVALRALAEAREASARFAATEPTPTLAPELRAQLADLGAHLPRLWESGRLTLAHKKDLLRSLIRRVILTRPRRDAVEASVVWISGAITTLNISPPVPQTADLSDYEHLLERVVALVREGYQDGAIARCLSAEGFRSAHTLAVPTSLVTRLRRQVREPSATTRFRSQEQVGGQWTVWGLSRRLGVNRDWLYARIRAGAVPARRHPVIGYYLIPDDPTLLAHLAAQRPAQRSAGGGHTTTAASRVAVQDR
jgi:hypothetical protein